jgi:hypothetical protein
MTVSRARKANKRRVPRRPGRMYHVVGLSADDDRERLLRTPSGAVAPTASSVWLRLVRGVLDELDERKGKATRSAPSSTRSAPSASCVPSTSAKKIRSRAGRPEYIEGHALDNGELHRSLGRAPRSSSAADQGEEACSGLVDIVLFCDLEPIVSHGWQVAGTKRARRRVRPRTPSRTLLSIAGHNGTNAPATWPDDGARLSRAATSARSASL